MKILSKGREIMQFKKYLFSFFIFASIQSQSSNTLNNGDILSETPLFPIPQEMSFEEYQDMNRRLSQGFIWSAVPIPGITHYYAGEKTKAKKLFYIGLGGLACVFAGAISSDEPEWPVFDPNIHIIHNQGTDNEIWYEKVPIGVDGTDVQYNLKEVRKENSGKGGGLVALGALIILGDFIYDRFKGIYLIEQKRDKVRYKYGKQLNLSFLPSINFSQKKARFELKLNFNMSRV